MERLKVFKSQQLPKRIRNSAEMPMRMQIEREIALTKVAKARIVELMPKGVHLEAEAEEYYLLTKKQQRILLIGLFIFAAVAYFGRRALYAEEGHPLLVALLVLVAASVSVFNFPLNHWIIIPTSWSLKQVRDERTRLELQEELLKEMHYKASLRLNDFLQWQDFIKGPLCGDLSYRVKEYDGSEIKLAVTLTYFNAVTNQPDEAEFEVSSEDYIAFENALAYLWRWRNHRMTNEEIMNFKAEALDLQPANAEREDGQPVTIEIVSGE